MEPFINLSANIRMLQVSFALYHFSYQLRLKEVKNLWLYIRTENKCYFHAKYLFTYYDYRLKS